MKRLKRSNTVCSQKGSLAQSNNPAVSGQKAGLVEPPVEEATHQQALEESVAEFEESVSKDSRVSVKKDDGEA